MGLTVQERGWVVGVNRALKMEAIVLGDRWRGDPLLILPDPIAKMNLPGRARRG